jgi:hypothetical protein
MSSQNDGRRGTLDWDTIWMQIVSQSPQQPAAEEKECAAGPVKIQIAQHLSRRVFGRRKPFPSVPQYWKKEVNGMQKTPQKTLDTWTLLNKRKYPAVDQCRLSPAFLMLQVYNPTL